MAMTKMFKDNGFLSEEGKKVLQPLHDELMELFSNPEVRNMSVSELRVLGANLAKAVGDLTSGAILARNQMAAKLAAMSDEQFEAYLKARYGEGWMFQSLTPEELERAPRLQTEEIMNTLKESAKHITKFPRNGIRFK
jgi:hypothetical protein